MIIVTSDLHYGITNKGEISKFVKKVKAEIDKAGLDEADLFVVAGDIGERGGYYMKCLELLEDIPAQCKVVIAGNHDLWTERKDIANSRQLWNDILPGVAEEFGWVWLEGKVVKVNDVAVIGSIVWYDYSASDNLNTPPEIIRLHKRHYNNDANYMDKDWDDLAFASGRQDELQQMLDATNSDEAVREVIVVTHVPVFREQHVRQQWDQPAGDAYFYNYTVGGLIAKYPKVSQVVSGHTHRGVDCKIARDGMQDIHVQTVDAEYHRPKFLVIKEFEQDDQG